MSGNTKTLISKGMSLEPFFRPSHILALYLVTGKSKQIRFGQQMRREAFLHEKRGGGV